MADMKLLHSGIASMSKGWMKPASANVRAINKDTTGSDNNSPSPPFLLWTIRDCRPPHRKRSLMKPKEQ